jgi:hypothetical protein
MAVRAPPSATGGGWMPFAAAIKKSDGEAPPLTGLRSARIYAAEVNRRTGLETGSIRPSRNMAVARSAFTGRLK